MKKRTRVAAVLGAATIGFAVAAVPAVAISDQERPTKPGGVEKPTKADKDKAAKAKEAAKKKAAKAKENARKRAIRAKKARARWDRCSIAEDRLLSGDDHRGLARFEKRLARLVASKRISQTRADRLMERRAKQVTVAVAINTARWAPVYKLFGVEDRKGLRVAVREAGGMRSLREREDLKITLKDLRQARREGRKESKGVRKDLCTSGLDQAEEKDTTDEKPESGEEAEKPESGEEAQKPGQLGDDSGEKPEGNDAD